MKPQFTVPIFDGCEKELCLGNLGAVELTVDYDDVDSYEVEELIPLVVEALNAIPKEKIAAAVKRAKARNRE